MYSFFDKHGKKLIAVVTALLALVFLLPAGFRGYNGDGTGALGKINGQRVNLADVQQAQNLLRSLDRLLVPVQTRSGQSQLVPAPAAMFGQLGEQLHQKFDQDPVLLYLLLREAQQIGAAADSSSVERMLTAPSVFRADKEHDIDIERLNPEIKDELREQLRQFASLIESFNRAFLSIKVSRPLVDDQLARLAQQIKVRAAAFDAADYEKVVPAPTADELQRQFVSYKDVAPVANPNNPFGFGYRSPDRLAVQWLTVPTADAAKAVEAARPPEKWEEDAYFYYEKNKAEFPTTQTAASTQPTPRSFDDAKADVLKKLREPLIEQKKREVANRIMQRLAAMAPSTQPTTGPFLSFSEPAYTKEALDALADAVVKQTGVRPTVTIPPTPLSHDELDKQPGLGVAELPDPSLQFPRTADYLFAAFKPLHADGRSPLPASMALDFGKPSAILTGIDGLYVARVVGYQKATPAESLDSVKAQVEKDVRHGRAYAMAADAATALLDKAKTAGGLDKVSGVKVETSDWFGATDPEPKGLTGLWAAQIVEPAFDVLRGLPSASALPAYTTAKLRENGQVVVVEVSAVQTQLNTDVEPMARKRAEQIAAQSLVTPAYVQQWFTIDSVSRRVGYVPEAPQKPAGPADPRNPASPNNPANPLLPG